MSSPVRIAIIGNSFAERVLLPALDHVGGLPGISLKVVGLAGSSGAKAAKTAQRWGIPKFTNRWQDLFDEPVDLAIIATPVDLHFEMARKALESGCAVLCEKPFTLTVAEAEELATLAKGRLALIDHQLRWNPNRRKLRDLIREGFIGEVLNLRTDLVLDNPLALKRLHSWWFEEERGGGTLGALGSHLIDGVQWMLGPIDTVSARLESFIKSRPDSSGTIKPVTADDFAELWMRTASGASVSLTTAVGMPGASRWLTEVAGSKGTLRIDMEDDLIGGLHGDDMAPITPDFPIPELPEKMKIGGPFNALAPLFLEDLVRAVAAGESTLAEAATFADGLANMRILEGARASSKLGGAQVDCR